MTSDRTILITGVTGHQGGAVARALQAQRRARLKAVRWLEYGGRLVFKDGYESYNTEPQAEGD